MTNTTVIYDDQINFDDSDAENEKLVLKGHVNAAFDEEIFLSSLSYFGRRNSILHIQVDISSNLKTCAFLEFFPRAQTLMLHGHVETTLGLSRANALRKLFIESSTRNGVRLEELEASNINHVEIKGARHEDLLVIGSSAAVETLKVVGGELVDFTILNKSNVKMLTYAGGKLEYIVGTNMLVRLEEVWLDACTKLREFAEVDMRIKALTIDACNKLNFSTLVNLRALESLQIMSCRQGIRLTDLDGLERLRYLSLSNCKIEMNEVPILKQVNLQKIWLSPARDSFIFKLSERNPGVLICNGNLTCLSGEKLPVATFYESI